MRTHVGAASLRQEEERARERETMPDLEDKPEYMGQPPYPTEMHKAADKHDVPKLEQLLADGAEGVEVKDVLNQARRGRILERALGHLAASPLLPRDSPEITSTAHLKRRTRKAYLHRRCR